MLPLEVDSKLETVWAPGAVSELIPLAAATIGPAATEAAASMTVGTI